MGEGSENKICFIEWGHVEGREAGGGEGRSRMTAVSDGSARASWRVTRSGDKGDFPLMPIY